MSVCFPNQATLLPMFSITTTAASTLQVDEYFAEHHASATKTSKHTLARLALAKMTEGDVWSYLRTCSDVIERDRARVFKRFGKGARDGGLMLSDTKNEEGRRVLTRCVCLCVCLSVCVCVCLSVSVCVSV